VNGYPSMKAYVNGKSRSYNGGRDVDSMHRFIEKIAANRGTKGGSSKCRAGMFKSKMKHAVVPLCETHFPDAKAKNDWIVFYYDHTATAEMRDALNSVALELGNYPPDINKANKKQIKIRERVEGLAKKHELVTTLPSKGPFGMDEIAKVGGVCCDCDEEHTAFCAGSMQQGEDVLKLPQVFMVSKGVRTVLKDTEMSAKALISAVLQQRAFVAKASTGEKADL